MSPIMQQVFNLYILAELVLFFYSITVINSTYASSLDYSSNQYYQHSEESHSNPYSFGYDIDDGYGNKQWRQEKTQGAQAVEGSYGYKDDLGIYREVHYVADKNGFRATVKTNEPGTDQKDAASVRFESHPVPSSVDLLSRYQQQYTSPSYKKSIQPPGKFHGMSTFRFPIRKI